MVVPIFTKKQLQVKLISSSDVCGLVESHIIEEVVHNGIKYIFGDVHKDLTKTSGMLLSVWYAKCHDDFLSLSYDWVTSLHSVYGDGFGSRDRCSCYGLNAYRSKRSTARPHPTPFVSDDDIAEHQYFNGAMKVPLLQPIMEKLISNLSDQVTMVSREMNIPLFKLVGNLCTKTILTAGSGHTSAHSLLSFTNTAHVDKCDILTIGQKKKLKMDNGISTNDNTYTSRLINMKEFCPPTSYCYMAVWKDEYIRGTTIQQYFSMNGLGIAVSIKPGYVHLFMASTFSHQTCVCMAFKLDDTVVINNNNDNYSMVACGCVGGKNEYRQASLQRKRSRYE